MKNARSEFDKLRETFVENRINFISCELELGLTFCSIAQTTRIAEFRERSLVDAQTALDTAAKALAGRAIPEDVARGLREKLARLSSILRDVRMLSRQRTGDRRRPP